MREVHKDEAMSKAQNFNIAFMETSAFNEIILIKFLWI